MNTESNAALHGYVVRVGTAREERAFAHPTLAAYALAKTMNAPLLFKGDDFTETDVMRASV